jgi:hypothetical protein
MGALGKSIQECLQTVAEERRRKDVEALLFRLNSRSPPIGGVDGFGGGVEVSAAVPNLIPAALGAETWFRCVASIDQ